MSDAKITTVFLDQFFRGFFIGCTLMVTGAIMAGKWVPVILIG
jgi:hypothetical protein